MTIPSPASDPGVQRVGLVRRPRPAWSPNDTRALGPPALFIRVFYPFKYASCLFIFSLWWGLLPLRLLCCVPLTGDHGPSGLKAGVVCDLCHTRPTWCCQAGALPPVLLFFFFLHCACSVSVLCAPSGQQHSTPKGIRDARCPLRQRGGARLVDQSALHHLPIGGLTQSPPRRARRSSSSFSPLFVRAVEDDAGSQMARSSPQ
ncbi:hypothetical protein NDU88_001718 [Pleurodeles waltl]|uniref:Uncharacterized protein n=1 Tax=Pleurodeles waltl TaxID=8319 RepID=A0AAV7UV47_PLEWA|nr:hypothetical protein NDU88_001718 [Pleurodeles waltl]